MILILEERALMYNRTQVFCTHYKLFKLSCELSSIIIIIMFVSMILIDQLRVSAKEFINA